jgi:hypothetical protein
LRFFAFNRSSPQNSPLDSSKICPNNIMSLWARQGRAFIDSYDSK